MSEAKCEDIRPTTSLHWGDIVTIVAYFVFVLLVGVWVSGLSNGNFHYFHDASMYSRLSLDAPILQREREREDMFYLRV